MFLWAPGQQRPIFDGFIYTHSAAPPDTARISTIYFLPVDSGGVCRWTALNVKPAILYLILYLTGNQWREWRSEVGGEEEDELETTWAEEF